MFLDRMTGHRLFPVPSVPAFGKQATCLGLLFFIDVCKSSGVGSRQSRLSLIELTIICTFFRLVGWRPIFSRPLFFSSTAWLFSGLKKCEQTAHKKTLFFLSWRQKRRPSPPPVRRKNLQTSKRNSDAEGLILFWHLQPKSNFFNPSQLIELDSSELH